MSLAVLLVFFPVDARAQAVGAQAADSLPAFKSDSAAADPFQKVEAGPSLWSSAPSGPPTSRDSLAAGDSAVRKLRMRYPAVAVYLGVDFMDLDAKEYFNTALNARASGEGLRILQPYEAVHLAFPLGIQALLPVSGYLDVVIKTHSYWYQQKAILGDTASRHAGDATFSAQANLGGLGLRFYVPPPLLSVTGGLGLFAQGVAYWNLGRSELYSDRGSAPARFEPSGSGYEFQFGIQKEVTGPWQLSGAIGFLNQKFTSRKDWSEIIAFSPPAGKAAWGGSALQATLNLWYRFGTPSPRAPADPAKANRAKADQEVPVQAN